MACHAASSHAASSHASMLYLHDELVLLLQARLHDSHLIWRRWHHLLTLHLLLLLHHLLLHHLLLHHLLLRHHRLLLLLLHHQLLRVHSTGEHRLSSSLCVLQRLHTRTVENKNVQ